MRNRKWQYRSNGDLVIRSLPHNKKASELYSSIIEKEFHRLENDVEELLKSKSIVKKCNSFNIHFEISGRNLFTIYEFENGNSAFESHKFKSIFANNMPKKELLLSIAKAECNAALSNNSNEITLYNFPAFAFYIPEYEADSVKFKIRQIVKNSFLFRFR